jgi:hypothetical protein
MPVPAVTVLSSGTAVTEADEVPEGKMSDVMSVPVEPSCKLSASEKLVSATSQTLWKAVHTPSTFEVPLGQKHCLVVASSWKPGMHDTLCSVDGRLHVSAPDVIVTSICHSPVEDS